LDEHTQFADFFKDATREAPFPYQSHFALSQDLPSLVDVPTGLGKTAMAVLGWLWRRRKADTAVQQATPRRLVYCLPMRVLVGQTRENAVSWLNTLDVLGGEPEFDQNGRLVRYSPDFHDTKAITVHTLMGGEDTGDWESHPERDMILIGTQDMLLSRALNRGYAAGRARWPMQFGLLHTDCLWIFDEIQLMGSGLATTAQLEAFRRILPREGADLAERRHGCRSVWMSATLNHDWLATVDFKAFLPNEPRLVFDFESEIASPGIDANAKKALEDRWKADKPLSRASVAMGDHGGLAAEIVEKHAERRGLTLVVVNTVDRAQRLHAAISKQVSEDSGPRLLLLHSRFRPPEREQKINELLEEELNRDMICVSTQVVEAGVDVDATTLFTELAPWASLVQRFGRCNRRGERDNNAGVFWIGLPEDENDAKKIAPPYELAGLLSAAEELGQLNDVGTKSLPRIDLPFQHAHVIRRKDLVDLFDTTPDLAGNDIEIDRYVREIEETDVRVLWRAWEQPEGYEPPPDEKAWRKVGRDEMCPAPIGEFKQFATTEKVKGKVWRWDFTEGRWEQVREQGSIYPGQTYLVHTSAGGYDPHCGWVGTAGKAAVEPLGPVEPEGLSDDAYDDDGLSKTDEWQTIAQHTDRVCGEAENIVEALTLTDPERAALRAAARWHDWGKAHEKFQIKIDDGQELVASDNNGDTQYRSERPEEWRGRRDIAKAPGERVDQQSLVQESGYWGRITAKDDARRHFRHELASALGVLRPDVLHETLDGVDRDLVAYLIAAHHGKVRLSIRSMPNETRPPADNGTARRFARGVWDTEKLPKVDLGGRVTAPAVTLSLEPMEIGLCEEVPFAGQPSWLERVIRLRDTLGPFRLAYLEALLRAADWWASEAAVTGAQPAEPEEGAHA